MYQTDLHWRPTLTPAPFPSFYQMDFGKHLLSRVFGLILLPLFLYVTIFAVHFVVLNKR